jgi:hypothetical protein
MSKEGTRFFQYIAGERQGEVLVYDHIEEEDDMIFIVFKDESRCNEDLIVPLGNREWQGKLMAEVSSTNPENLWTFDTKYVGRQEEKWSPPEESPDGVSHLVQPFLPGKKKVTPKPPKKIKSVFGTIDKHVETAKPAVEEKPKYDGDPVWLMMEKAKKFDTDIEMTVTISLPTKSLYEVAKESFEEGGSKVIEYIIENLDNQKLKDSLKTALREAYGEITHMPDQRFLQEPEAVQEPEIRPATEEEIEILGTKEIKKLHENSKKTLEELKEIGK